MNTNLLIAAILFFALMMPFSFIAGMYVNSAFIMLVMPIICGMCLSVTCNLH